MVSPPKASDVLMVVVVAVRSLIVVVASVEVPVTPIVPENVAAAAPSVPVSVGLAEKTARPVPVSSLNFPARSALENAARSSAKSSWVRVISCPESVR